MTTKLGFRKGLKRNEIHGSPAIKCSGTVISNLLGTRAKSIEKKKCLKGHIINNTFYSCTIKDRLYPVINSANNEAVKNLLEINLQKSELIIQNLKLVLTNKFLLVSCLYQVLSKTNKAHINNFSCIPLGK